MTEMVESVKSKNPNNTSLDDLRHIFEYSEDGIYVVDGRGYTLMANPSFARFCGVTEGELIGRKVSDLVSKNIFSRSAAMEAIKKKETVTITQEYSTGKVCLVTSNPIIGEDGTVERVISNIRDVTELSGMYDELRAKEKLLSEYSKMLEERNLISGSGIIAESDSMLRMIRMAKKVAASDYSALVLGESGVGKSMIVRFIAQLSDRAGKPLVELNCGSIPENLIESELFGYEEGSFTGARKNGKVGLIEAADGGILFLDEIAELPMTLQPKLLLFLEDKTIMRVGSVKKKKVDVRIIAATNKNLEDLVANGQFREDLYYRLNVLPITIPPLRERPEDIIPLVNNFLADYNKRNDENIEFSPGVLRAFYNFDWPGNIRQLKNVVERMMVLSESETVDVEELPQELRSAAPRQMAFTDKTEFSFPLSMPDTISELEKNMILAAMEEGGSLRKAAELLGITYSSLFRRIRKFENMDVSIAKQPKQY